MFGIDSPQLNWLLCATELLGLGIAWMARVSEGSSHQNSLQLAFFALLTVIGGVTLATLGLGSGQWLTCSVTLTLMVLTVTWDFGRSSRDVVW